MPDRPSAVARPRARLMVKLFMYEIYVLKSLKASNLYVGCTSNLDKRLEYHNQGKVFSTKGRLPIKLIYSENYDNKYEAYRTEKFYKTAKGKRVLKNKMQ